MYACMHEIYYILLCSWLLCNCILMITVCMLYVHIWDYWHLYIAIALLSFELAVVTDT